MNQHLQSTITFVNSYFQHPFWKEARLEGHIRLCLSYSDFLKKKLVEDRLMTLADSKRKWHISDKVISARECSKLSESQGELAKLITLADTKGCNLYYSINVALTTAGEDRDGEVTLRLSESDIKNVLFIPIDWDTHLPISVLGLFRRVDLQPWAIVQTSNRKKDGKRYQALIGVRVEDSREFSRWKEVTKLAAHTLRGDISINNLNRVFRLPGGYNWKGFTAGVALDRALLVKQVSIYNSDLPAKLLVYPLEVIEQKLQRFAESDEGKELAFEVPLQGVCRGGGERGGSSGERLITVRWREALHQGEENGKVSYKQGMRHSALISWAGELAVDVDRGLISEAKARSILRRLAHSACAWKVSEYDECRIEFEGAVRYLRDCIAEDYENGKLTVEYILDKHIENRFSTLEDDAVFEGDSDD